MGWNFDVWSWIWIGNGYFTAWRIDLGVGNMEVWRLGW